MIDTEAREAACTLEALYQAHGGRLWSLAYRMTGSAADADDVVQETFLRLHARRPEVAADLRPWLVRVATNLAIDTLRARRRRPYPGPWLPAPSERDEAGGTDALPSGEPGPEARYGLLESATFAFLLALEALGPRQRAVLLFRDVLGYSADETARVLATTDGNVRVLHLRARRAMARYDRARCVPTPASRARHREALTRFMQALAAQDARALEDLLSESVRTVTDAGGEYTALARVLVGRASVARLYLRAALGRAAGDPRVEIRCVNGLPAALVSLARPVRRQAPRTLLLLDVGEDGRIESVYGVLASRKLAALETHGAVAGPV